MLRIGSPLPYPDPPIAGAGFTLRPFRPGDFEAARALERDEVAARWVPPLPGGDGEAVASFYEDCRRAGELLHLVVADATDDSYVGEVMAAVGEHRVIELGTGLAPVARGRGIATRSFGAFADWVLATLDVERLQVFVATENVRALRVAERSGFSREGVLRAYWDGPEGRVDVVVLSRLPGEQRQA
jgi:RimJ/RimL family protein N-acetyltransferase